MNLGAFLVRIRKSPRKTAVPTESRHRRGWARFRERRGAASILVILMIVLLAFFAILPLVAAGAEMRLARRRAAWNQQFYAVDAFAEQIYGEIQTFARDPDRAAQALAVNRAALEQLLQNAQADEIEITDAAPDLLVRLLVAVPDGPQRIRLSLRVQVPARSEDPVTILGWAQEQIPPTGTEATGGVWQG